MCQFQELTLHLQALWLPNPYFQPGPPSRLRIWLSDYRHLPRYVSHTLLISKSCSELIRPSHLLLSLCWSYFSDCSHPPSHSRASFDVFLSLALLTELLLGSANYTTSISLSSVYLHLHCYDFSFPLNPHMGHCNCLLTDLLVYPILIYTVMWDPFFWIIKIKRALFLIFKAICKGYTPFTVITIYWLYFSCSDVRLF